MRFFSIRYPWAPHTEQLSLTTLLWGKGTWGTSLPTTRADTVNMDNTNGCPACHTTSDLFFSEEHVILYSISFIHSFALIARWCSATDSNWTRTDRGHPCSGFYPFAKFRPGCLFFSPSERTAAHKDLSSLLVHTSTPDFNPAHRKRISPCPLFPPTLLGQWVIQDRFSGKSTIYWAPNILPSGTSWGWGFLEGKGLSPQPKQCRMLVTEPKSAWSFPSLGWLKLLLSLCCDPSHLLWRNTE